MFGINGRGLLMSGASALVLSWSVALAQEGTGEGATDPETEMLVEVPASGDAVAVNEGDVGTAVQHLEGVPAGEIEGLAVFDESGLRIGTVRMVAESESGGVYLIVSSEDESVAMVPGNHAVPLPRFNYDPEAQALVMWGGYAATTGTAAPPTTAAPGAYGSGVRLYTVLGDETEVPRASPEAYQRDYAPAMPEEEEDLAELSNEQVIQPAADVVEGSAIANIVGRDVIDRGGELIGEVEELGADAEGDLFLVVELRDGFLGFGRSERAVKLDAFQYSLADEAFVLLDTSVEAVEALPTFERDTPGLTIFESDLDWERFK